MCPSVLSSPYTVCRAVIMWSPLSSKHAAYGGGANGIVNSSASRRVLYITFEQGNLCLVTFSRLSNENRGQKSIRKGDNVKHKCLREARAAVTTCYGWTGRIDEEFEMGIAMWSDGEMGFGVFLFSPPFIFIFSVTA